MKRGFIGVLLSGLCLALPILLGSQVQAQTVQQMRWSSAGPIPGMHCVQIHEGSSPAAHTWRDNYLCTDRDVGLRWSSAGPIGGMRCTQIVEGAEPLQHTWRDNYLCLPNSSPITLRWSPQGPLAGLTCVQIHEGRDPYGWHDNFLCYSQRQQTADLLTITRIRNIKPAGGIDAAGQVAFGIIGAAVATAGSGGISVGDLYNGAKYGVQVGNFLDRHFSGADDLIIMVDGRTYLHKTTVYGGQVMNLNLQAAISGAGQLQLIEWDGGSDNDNLGMLTILGGRSYSANDIVIAAPAAEDGSIYLVSYRVEAGRGNPAAVTKSMMCGTNQCEICNRLDCQNQGRGGMDRDGDKPDLLRCPPHFNEAGFRKFDMTWPAEDVYLRICRHKMVR